MEKPEEMQEGIGKLALALVASASLPELIAAKLAQQGIKMGIKKIYSMRNKPLTEGRASKNPADNQEHVIMQMRKNITMNGSKPIKFADGQSHTIPSSHAQKVLNHYGSMAKPDHKDQFQKHIGSSHRNMSDWLGGKKFEPTTATDKPKDRGINNDEIFGHKGLKESSTVRTIKSLAHRKMLTEQKEQRAAFRAHLRSIIAEL